MEVTIPFREFTSPHPLTVHVQKVERYLGNLEHLVQTFQQAKLCPDLENATKEKFEEHIRGNFDQANHFVQQLPEVCPDLVVQTNLQQRLKTRVQKLWWQYQELEPIPVSEEQMRLLAGELRDLQQLVQEANQLLQQQHQLVSTIETNMETAVERVEEATQELDGAHRSRSWYVKVGVASVFILLFTTFMILGITGVL